MRSFGGVKLAMKIHWARVVIAAFVLEIVLFVTLVPIGQVFGNTVFLIAVPIGCLVFGFVITFLFTKGIKSRAVLHGFLIGVLATIIYVGLVVGSPDGMSTAMSVYGPFLFLFYNALRIVGTVLAGTVCQRKQFA
jgi:hypothetical protein